MGGKHVDQAGMPKPAFCRSARDTW